MTEVLRVVIVDDDPDGVFHLENACRSLSDWSVQCVSFESGTALTDDVLSRCDVLLIDHVLADGTAADVVASLRARGHGLPIIVVTGHRGGNAAVSALRSGADDFLMKDELSADTLSRSVRHVLDRSKARHALRMHGAILDAIGEAVVATTPDGKIAYWNRAAEHLYGFTIAEARTHNLGAMLQEAQSSSASEIAEAMTRGEEWAGEFRAPHRDGRSTPAYANVSPVRDPAGRLLGVVGVAIDISERKRAERQAREHAEVYTLLFNESPLPKWIFDTQTLELIGVNRAAEETFGYSRDEFLAMHLTDMVPEMDPEALRIRVANRPIGVRTRVGVVRAAKKNGDLLEVDVTSQKMRLGDRDVELSTLVDVSPIREAERALHRSELRLQQAQKMEAVGQLAGGVAHDFNNILTAIRGYADIVRGSLPRGSGNHRDLLEITAAVDRAASLTQQLLAFSRGQVLKPVLLDVSTVVREMDGMLRRIIGEHIELTVRAFDHMPSVMADRSQIEQVVVNLVVNARDAMPRGGILLIQVQAVTLDQAFVNAHPGSRVGPCVRLSVSDDGEGMSPEVRARAFEPFFTTKDQGKGTGLGLSMVYGIVKQSEGYVEIESEPQKGTRVDIYLPLAEGTSEEVSASEASAESSSIRWGFGTVLVVEDSAGVRTVLRRALESQGFEVIEAPDGRRALEMATKYRGTIDLLVTDLIMPRMSGSELVNALHDLGRAMPVLITSGHPRESVMQHALPEHAVFIEKPFTTAALLAGVRSALEQSRP